jgi:hypothetical protein
MAMEKTQETPVIAPNLENNRTKINTKEAVKVIPNNEVSITRAKIGENDPNKNIEDTSLLDAVAI